MIVLLFSRHTISSGERGLFCFLPMVAVNCPHCSEPSAVDSSLLGQPVVCANCGAEFVAQVAEPSAQEEKRVTRKKQDDMPLADVIKWALVGVMLIGALGVGAYIWIDNQKVAAFQARIREELLAEKAAKAEEERGKAEERRKLARKEREISGGLTTYQVQARSLYMKVWEMMAVEEIRWIEDWPECAHVFMNGDAAADLKEMGLSGTDLIRMVSTWWKKQDTGSVERIAAKWDDAFGLADGKAKSDEQAELIAQQEKEVSSRPVVAEREQNLGNTGDVHGAWVYAQAFVKERLKSPKSADFPFDGFRSVVNLGADRYRVPSYVDSTNPFGVELRRKFTCTLRNEGSRWVLESLTFY